MKHSRLYIPFVILFTLFLLGLEKYQQIPFLSFWGLFLLSLISIRPLAWVALGGFFADFILLRTPGVSLFLIVGFLSLGTILSEAKLKQFLLWGITLFSILIASFLYYPQAHLGKLLIVHGVLGAILISKFWTKNVKELEEFS